MYLKATPSSQRNQYQRMPEGNTILAEESVPENAWKATPSSQRNQYQRMPGRQH